MSKGQFPSEQSGAGEFNRQPDEFRDWIRRDGSTPFAPEAGRYQLHISLACPWACRAWIALRLKRLESAVGVTVVDPIRTDEEGWAFCGRDPITGFRLLREAYLATDPHFWRSFIGCPGLPRRSISTTSSGIIISRITKSIRRALCRSVPR